MIAGLVAVLAVGISPRAVPKITLSPFQSPTVLANAFTMRINEELKNSDIIVLGFEATKEHEQILKSIVDSMKLNGVGSNVIIADSKLEWEIPDSVQFDIMKNPEPLVNETRQTFSNGKKVVIVTGNIHSTQLLKNNLVGLIKTNIPNAKLLSVSFSWFPRNKEEENQMPIKCETGNDPLQTADYGCWVLQNSRIQYRKKKDLTGPMGLMSQVGMNDYIFMVRN